MTNDRLKSFCGKIKNFNATWLGTLVYVISSFNYVEYSARWLTFGPLEILEQVLVCSLHQALGHGFYIIHLFSRWGSSRFFRFEYLTSQTSEAGICEMVWDSSRFFPILTMIDHLENIWGPIAFLATCQTTSIVVKFLN